MRGESSGVPLLVRRIANRIGHPFGINPFPRAFPNPLSQGEMPSSKVFDEVYLQNYWGSEQSRSGVGSETAFTSRYRTQLAELLRARGLNRVFDAPCGDLNWMPKMIAETGIEYLGGDISLLVIENARLRHPAYDLRVFDITADPFPAADVWHCRDCLFHLPFVAMQQAFQNFLGSTIPYALLTSHCTRLLHRNLNVGLGGFRLLDLEQHPISLPRPLDRIVDFRRGYDFPRYVCLWSREQIATAIGTEI